MVNKDATPRTGGTQGYLRIATEEAFATRSQLAAYHRLLDDPGFDDPGFRSLWGFYGTSQSERAKFIYDRLQDLGEARLADMDAAGIDHAILALTSPGVQVFEPAEGTALAIEANDLLQGRLRCPPDPIQRHDCDRPAGRPRSGHGTRARRAQARLRRR